MNHQDNYMEDPKIPHQDDLRSTDSFRIPAFYFESFPDRIMKHIEMEAVPAALREKIFRVPNGYFESFTNRLMDRLLPQQTTKTIRTGFRRSLMYSAAAVVLILVSWFVISLFRNQTNIDYLAESSEEELLEYVSTYAFDFDQNILASVIGEEEINSLDIMDEMDDETSDLLIELYE